MSNSTEAPTALIIVSSTDVEQFKHHIDRTIRYGRENESDLREDPARYSLEMISEMEEYVRLGRLTETVTCHGPRDLPDYPNPEVEFEGPREALRELADNMARDASSKIHQVSDEISRESIATIWEQVQQLENWWHDVEQLSGSKAVS